MKKIPSLFVRDFERDPRFVLPIVTPGCEWVLQGEGVPTRKRDGTACLLDDSGRLWRRYDAKGGKAPPAGFQPAQDPDPKTGHWPGWLLVGDGPQDKWYHDAPWPNAPGTYELCGPKFQTNAEGLAAHTFFRHGSEVLPSLFRPNGAVDVPSELIFAALREVFTNLVMEGIVWHHPDGRMAKLKRSDFGLPWPIR